VRISVRRVRFAMTSGCKWQAEWALAHARLFNAAQRCAAAMLHSARVDDDLIGRPSVSTSS
jgi:hypothetical protein